MRKLRVPRGAILPALLIGLVGVLAALQYRWLGQVSQAEREQLRRSLSQRAREFADDFDLEISRAYLTLQLAPEALASRDWTAFAEAGDRWRATARFPQMIRDIYLAEPDGDHLALRRYDPGARGFSATTLAAWPASLEPVRSRLTGSVRTMGGAAAGAAKVIAITVTPVLADVPAIVVPVPMPGLPDAGPRSPAAREARGAMLWLEGRGSFIVIELDGAFVRGTMLPTLVQRHFPERDAGQYRLAVVGDNGRAVFARGLPAGAQIAPDRADAVEPFFSLRLDIARDFVGSTGPITFRARTGPPAGTPGSRPEPSGDRVSVFVEQRSATVRTDPGGTAAPRTVRLVHSGWRIVLQHPAGSLDAAVGQARVRNLWLSFGILGILAAGVVLVVVNARRAEHLAARQLDFVATVSHELRTPLAVIRSAAQNLAAGVVTDPAQARRYGELIEADGRRLTDMVEEVLTYAGLSGSRQLRAARSIDVAAIVRDVVASCRPLIEAGGCAADVDADGQGLPPVVADEAAIRRAVHNLVTNAVRYGADGGWIGVSARRVVTRGRGAVQIVVQDRGHGIDADDLAHVFEPFYRGRYAIDHQIHGNGLGLSLVKRIAEAHGGRVTVRSEPGHGATFTLHLPAAAPVAAEERLGDPAPQAGPSA